MNRPGIPGQHVQNDRCFVRGLQPTAQVPAIMYPWRPSAGQTRWRPIGSANLHRIRGRTATFAIAIGEKDCWGKGYGTEATRLTLDYGFSALGLHNILLSVMADHERAIRAYTRAGFTVIGTRHEALRFAGRVYDHIYMECLATGFDSPVLRWLLAD